jgi:hypothetical protein
MKHFVHILIVVCAVVCPISNGYSYVHLRPISSRKNPANIEQGLYSGAIGREYAIIQGAYDQIAGVSVLAYSWQRRDYRKSSSAGDIDILWNDYLHGGTRAAVMYLNGLGQNYPFSDIQQAVLLKTPIDRIRLYYILYEIHKEEGYFYHNFVNIRNARIKLLKSFFDPERGTREGFAGLVSGNMPGLNRRFLSAKDILMLVLIQSARKGTLVDFVDNSVLRWGKSNASSYSGHYKAPGKTIVFTQEDINIVRYLSGVEKGSRQSGALSRLVARKGIAVRLPYAAEMALIKWLAKEIYQDYVRVVALDDVERGIPMPVQLEMFPHTNTAELLIRQSA